MKDPYQVLGISPDADDDEVKRAYHDLARKYHPDNYTKDNPLADLANEKMKEINEAYDEIRRRRSGKGSTGGGSTAFNAIRQLINSGRFADADTELEKIPDTDRNAEWHYLKSIVFMRRGWMNDAMTELNTACQMDPGNEEYERTRQMFRSNAAGYGAGTGQGYGAGRPRTTGRNDCSACDMCTGLLAADCCCECLGGDLIRCC